ncbi:MAG: fumarylacetoacetate hydrolase family protein [Pigmentiphaga sp.]|uniref:fumarylacetoacetate hydrolase family protein n=1 Tax=Pigmentiphaga sp. TaxID=1977564 RepID=UPI0029B558AC|nr:fumarylacetoacetate hydrolase family protein [Pigmentiphaga sp.]MDX3907218.1 fumarylacetoacetate hydrolase family protein [Pigmentiphaga sp.]
MKLVSYTLPETPHAPRVGFVVSENQFVDVETACGRFLPDVSGPFDIHRLIEAGPELWDRLRDIEAMLAHGAGASLPRADLSTIRFLPAVPRPSKICCLALNNSANSERIVKGPRHPAVFTKPWTALVGHGEPVRLKLQYGRVHPEPELAVVIGKLARDIDASQAYDHVFGYTIHNDLTSPTMRDEDSFHYRAIHPAAEGEGIRYVDSHVSYSGRYKGSDTFSPLGPWIVTRDEIADPHALDIACDVRDERFASDNTANLFHKLPEVLAFVSSYMTLVPGDVVSLGTALASGGKPGRAVQNADLNKMGGPVSVTVAGIGTLSNPVQRV